MLNFVFLSYPNPGEERPIRLTPAQARTHFGSFAILSSPLTLSFDLRDARLLNDLWPVIGNREALAVNDAWAFSAGGELARAAATAAVPGCQGCEAARWPLWQALYKPLPQGAAALLFINSANATLAAGAIAVDPARVPGLAAAAHYRVRDVWARADAAALAAAGAPLRSPELPPYDSAFFVLYPEL